MDIEQMKKELAELRAYKEAAEKQKPVAWGAFYYGGKYRGQLYSHDSSEEKIDDYIAYVHRSNDSITLQKGPLYANPIPAEKPVTRQDVIDVLLSTRGQSEGVTADAILGLLSDKAAAAVPDAIQLLQRVAASTVDKPAVAVPDGWNIVTNENWNIPRVGQRVILFSNGVVQEESYTLDQADGEPGCGYYFWNRDDLDECPEVKAGDMWISWPDAAAPSHSQQSALEPVEGDLLPPVGTNVAIHLASNDKWVNHKVVGYYVWGPLGGVSDSYSRVFVRVVDGHGIQNARLLKDIKWDRCPGHESEQGKSIDDLPGMWCESDLSGGWADSCNQQTEGEIDQQ